MTRTIGSCLEPNKLGNGRYSKSDRFNAGGHSWRVAFYPNGRLAGTTASMSLFLLLDDEDDNSDGGRTAATAAAADEIVAHVKFSFVLLEMHDDTPVFMSSTMNAAFSRRSNAHGFEHFVSRDDFEKTALSKSDRFRIQFRFKISRAVAAAATSSKSSVVRVPPSAQPPTQKQSGPPATATVSVPAGQRATVPLLSGLPADLGRLLATKERADVELEVRGKVFAAHKCVLSARSPVFMEELFGPAKEEHTISNVRIIPDMRPEAFEVLLHYLYTDTLPPAPDMTMSSLEECVVLAEDLLAAADRYDLKDLKLLTENKLCNHVGVSSVLPMLGLAERYKCCKLKKMCLAFIGSCGNTSAVMATNDLEILARSSPSVIKDVISEILDARRRRLIIFCIFALCFILPFLLFAILS